MPNAPCPVVSRLTVSRLPRGHVFGYPCDAASAAAYGRLPEWPKGAVCKTAGSAYGGSNPPAPTTRGEYATVSPLRGSSSVFVTVRGKTSHRRRWDCQRPWASLKAGPNSTWSLGHRRVGAPHAHVCADVPPACMHRAASLRTRRSRSGCRGMCGSFSVRRPSGAGVRFTAVAAVRIPMAHSASTLERTTDTYTFRRRFIPPAHLKQPSPLTQPQVRDLIAEQSLEVLQSGLQ